MSQRPLSYQDVADEFIAGRTRSSVGVATVNEWAGTLPAGGSVLDLGCGCGIPISDTLIRQGFSVFGVDSSAKMIAAFRARFTGAPAECNSIEDSTFFGRKFDGVIAWGLFFLLSWELSLYLASRGV